MGCAAEDVHPQKETGEPVKIITQSREIVGSEEGGRQEYTSLGYHMTEEENECGGGLAVAGWGQNSWDHPLVIDKCRSVDSTLSEYFRIPIWQLLCQGAMRKG